ncbi:nuclear transport factor 2 family protein [Colwelliaceae bacterium 6441]
MTNKNKIKQQLAHYFDGLYFNDLSLLANVFHPLAHYCCTTGGELTHLSMGEYFQLLKKRQSPFSKDQQRQDKIILIDVIGESTALAKVQCVIEPKYFTDLLSFIHIEGRWQIISKVFDYKLNEF